MTGRPRGQGRDYGDAEEAFASEDPFVRQFLSGESAGPLGMDKLPPRLLSRDFVSPDGIFAVLLDAEATNGQLGVGRPRVSKGRNTSVPQAPVISS
jgi:hypothetical protein